MQKATIWMDDLFHSAKFDLLNDIKDISVKSTMRKDQQSFINIGRPSI